MQSEQAAPWERNGRSVYRGMDEPAFICTVESESIALERLLNAQQAAITAAIEALEIAWDAEMLAWPEYRDKYKLAEDDNGTWLNDKISAALSQLRAVEKGTQ